MFSNGIFTYKDITQQSFYQSSTQHLINNFFHVHQKFWERTTIEVQNIKSALFLPLHPYFPVLAINEDKLH
ncbi:Protein of unknown function [Gryllus bimaculatus]|nr:Protein of unknown function [Gryllus bimaculatus]